jgi:hypothetical protein
MPLYQSFRRIKRKGFTYDFNLHEEDIVKPNYQNCTSIVMKEFKPDDEG